MSEREKLNETLDAMPSNLIGYVLAFAQGLALREKADDEFCERLYQDYLNDGDAEKDKEFTLEECRAEWGLS